MSAIALLLAFWLGAFQTPPPAEDDQLVPRLMTLSQAVLWYQYPQCSSEPVYERFDSNVWVGAMVVCPDSEASAGFYFNGDSVTWEVHEP